MAEPIDNFDDIIEDDMSDDGEIFDDRPLDEEPQLGIKEAAPVAATAGILATIFYCFCPCFACC